MVLFLGTNKLLIKINISSHIVLFYYYKIKLKPYLLIAVVTYEMY